MRSRAAITTTLAALAATPAALAQTSTIVTASRARTRRPAPETPAPWWKLAMFRVMAGAANIRGARPDAVTEWTVDLHAGLRLFDSRPSGGFWIFGGDVGLSLGPRGNGEMSTLWLGGPGVSYGGFWLTIGWSPRFVFGTLDTRNAIGLRNTLSACLFVGVACVDVSHQWLSVDEGSQQDIRLTLGLDLGMLAQVIVQFANARPG